MRLALCCSDQPAEADGHDTSDPIFVCLIVTTGRADAAGKTVLDEANFHPGSRAAKPTIQFNHRWTQMNTDKTGVERPVQARSNRALIGADDFCGPEISPHLCPSVVEVQFTCIVC